MFKITPLISLALISSTLPTLSACAAPAANGVTVEDILNKPADQVFYTLADEKAYYALLQFEVQANQLASTAVDMGVIQPGTPTANTLANLLLKLTDVSNAAKQAKAVNDANGLALSILQGRHLYDEILKMLS